MMASVFRAEMGQVTVNWREAGEKTYTGIALVRDSEKGICQAMLRISDKAKPAEYASLKAAALKLAEYAEQCEQAALAAEKTAKLDSGKLTDGQRERIREALKGMLPAARVATAAALMLSFDGFTLADFGYDPATGKAVAEKPPTPPKNGKAAATDAVSAVLASVGK